MAAVMKYILLVLKYAVQIGPLAYEGSVWAIRIIREWRKKTEKKDPSVAPAPEPPVDAKPDPG